MTRINYKSDFDIALHLRDCKGDAVAWKEITADEAGRINAARQSGETANDKTDE